MVPRPVHRSPTIAVSVSFQAMRGSTQLLSNWLVRPAHTDNLAPRPPALTQLQNSCYFAFVLPILEYCSPVWGSAADVTFSFLSARCIRWPGFVLIKVSCRCVINVMLLDWVCCTRLIITLITVWSSSFYLLLLEYNIVELRPQLIHWSLMYQGVERPNLLCLSCWFECGMIFPYSVFNTGTLDGFMGAVNCWFLPWVVFSSVFRGALWDSKATYKQLHFSTWACAAGFNNNNILAYKVIIGPYLLNDFLDHGDVRNQNNLA